MNTNIKNLYRQVRDKKSLIFLLSKEFGVRPNSIRCNWFSTYWSIPSKYEARVLRILQNTVTHQNSVTV